MDTSDHVIGFTNQIEFFDIGINDAKFGGGIIPESVWDGTLMSYIRVHDEVVRLNEKCFGLREEIFKLKRIGDAEEFSTFQICLVSIGTQLTLRNFLVDPTVVSKIVEGFMNIVQAWSSNGGIDAAIDEASVLVTMKLYFAVANTTPKQLVDDKAHMKSILTCLDMISADIRARRKVLLDIIM